MKVYSIILTLCATILAGYTVGSMSTSLRLQSEIRETLWEQDSMKNELDAQINAYVEQQYKYASPRDYQLAIVEDSVLMYDGNRLVGTFKLQYDADPVGTMIEEDNQ